ncbi:MAG TPA: dihydrolipoyl dehydrogenase [Methylomirabilota bacterium]|jgi:dihydrolipoamide dehydrogenase|nr:dihydrolipoyl dehydrogenase [Methylomirabilota bacterium]
MPSGREHDLVVIGAGPGGYVAAIRAAQLGMNVACVERDPALGGTCLRIGCIPSKALLESSELFAAAGERFGAHGVRVGDLTLDLAAMLHRKDETVRGLTGGVDGLFRKHRIARHVGHGRIIGPGAVSVENGSEVARITARRILIATGSTSSSLPGVAPDGDRIGTSTEALAYPAVPGHLVVIGAGYIGLELGSVWHRLGAKVTIVEYLDRILPGMDAEVSASAKRIFEAQGLAFRLRSRVTGVRVEAGGCVVECEGAEPVRGDRVLVAVGRSPVTADLGLESVGIQPDEQGRIAVDEGFATEADGVYAVGDVIRGPMLAHKASEEGIACVEMLAGGHGRVDYDAIPSVVYTFPEIAAVGRTEEQLQVAGIDYRKGVFPFRANGRARALGQTEGQIKMLADTKTDRVLGVHILGPRAGDLIAEAVSAMAFGASSEDVARTCHAHPTLAEAYREAALAVEGRALHI